MCWALQIFSNFFCALKGLLPSRHWCSNHQQQPIAQMQLPNNHFIQAMSLMEGEDSCLKLQYSAMRTLLTMPEERMPLSLAGFRFAKTSTFLPSISSSGTNFTSPDTICQHNTPYIIQVTLTTAATKDFHTM